MRVVCIVLFILWRWYGNLFSGPGKVLVLVLTKKSWSWSWSGQKSLIYITGYSSTESVMSTICLDVWLHGSKKSAEIPRYEVLRLGFDHTSTQMVTLRAHPQLSSTDCVHLSQKLLVQLRTPYWRYDRTPQNGRSMLS